MVEGSGIRVYKANKSKVRKYFSYSKLKGNDITKCQIGIEVISGEPLIIMNKIK
jgi:hypothetical protein